MVKGFCLFAIFLGFSYFGIAIGRSYGKKEKFFSEVLMFLNILSNNIKFNKNKLNKIIAENIDGLKTEFKGVLGGSREDISFLTKYENEKLFEFLNSIGNFDVDGEINNIESYKQIFNNFHSESLQNNKKYGALYSKLGIMLGLVVVIIFI